MRRTGLAIFLMSCSGVVAACGSSSTSSTVSTGASGGTANCPAPSGNDGNGAKVSIGSKPFAEEQLLAEIAKLVLEKHGFTVEYTTQAADPAIGQALQNGTIDMLWQYTGTELQKYLGVDKPPGDLDAAFELAREKDDPKGLCWVAKAPMNDTNGIAIRASDAATFGTTLTQFTTYLQSHPDTKVCILSEFRTRADGVPGLKATYGDVWGGFNYTDIGSTAEKALNRKDCDAGEVFTTDSPISAFNLMVLRDDKKFFPPDNVGLVVRSSVLKAHPAIANLLNPVAAKITSDEITKLNKKVEIDGLKPEDVARAWLTENSLL